MRLGEDVSRQQHSGRSGKTNEQSLSLSGFVVTQVCAGGLQSAFMLERGRWWYSHFPPSSLKSVLTLSRQIFDF